MCGMYMRVIVVVTDVCSWGGDGLRSKANLIQTKLKSMKVMRAVSCCRYCLAVAMDEFGLSVQNRKAPSLAKDIEHYEEAVSSMLRAEKIYTWLSTEDSEVVKARCGTPEERLGPCVENRQSAQVILYDVCDVGREETCTTEPVVHG